MFGLFSKKKKPQNALDELIFAIYGNPPPPKRASVRQAVEMADDLLVGLIDKTEVSNLAINLNDGPIPYSTHDLALSIALNFFKQPKYVPQLFEAQLLARMKVAEWLQEGLVAPLLVKNFESTLYELYKPRMEGDGESAIRKLLVATQRELFNIYRVAQPTDAQRIKASAYLCIAGIAIMNDLGGARLSPVIDKLVEEAKELTKPLKMRAGELSSSPEHLRRIMSDFPKRLQITEATTINGLAAFEALYFSMGQELVNDILNHNEGPLGASGYAAIVITEGIFGKGEFQDEFMDVSMEILNFTEELVNSI